MHGLVSSSRALNIEHLSSDARGEPSLAAEAEGTNAEGEYVRVRNGY